MPYNLRSKKRISGQEQCEVRKKSRHSMEGNVLRADTKDPVILEPPFSGQFRYVRGYSGPPGSKGLKILERQSRLYRPHEAKDLDDLGDSINLTGFMGVRGPAGMVSVKNRLEEKIRKKSLFRGLDEAMTVLAFYRWEGAGSGSIKGAFLEGDVLVVRVGRTSGFSGQMQSQYKRFSAVLISNVPANATVRFEVD